MAQRHYLLTRVLPVFSFAALTITSSCKDNPAPTADAAASMPSASTVAPLASTPPAMSASAMAEGGEKAGGEKHGGGHGGPAAMLFNATKSLTLKDDQKAKIDAAEKDAHAGPSDGMKDAMKDLHTEVIAQIKAGKIDNSKLEPKYAAVDKIVTASHDKEVAALNALYGALDATQRKAVVADVRAKNAAREAKMAEHMAEMGMADGGADGGKGGPGAMMAKRAFDHLTNGLDLDADQQKKVDALVAKEDAAAKPGMAAMAEMKKNQEALLAAFEKDGFDAKKAVVFDAKKARGPMESEAKYLTALLPILKPEQRDKLAAKMEKPSPHGRRPGGMGGHRPITESDDDDTE